MSTELIFKIKMPYQIGTIIILLYVQDIEGRTERSSYLPKATGGRIMKTEDLEQCPKESSLGLNVGMRALQFSLGKADFCVRNHPTQLRTDCSLILEPSVVADIIFVEFSWKANMAREKLKMCTI